MKRYSLQLKNDTKQSLESLVALYEGTGELVLTYGDLAEPKRFAKAMLARFKEHQVYNLFEEEAEKVLIRDYVLWGLNEKARMLCFLEIKDDTYLKEHGLELETISSFHLHWDNHSGFKIKWPKDAKQALKD